MQRFNDASRVLVLLAVLCGYSARGADTVAFRDEFRGKLALGWTFVRRDTNGVRVLERGLEIRIDPGNMWGPENSGRNVMLRDAPDPSENEVEISVTVSNRPTSQYEQVDLVWYYADSHMVKVGLERVDGQLSIVMGREENDHTKTIAVIPIQATRVELKHLVKGNHIRGQYRPAGAAAWLDAGECDLPVHGRPKLSLQCYQGPRNEEHWALIEDFTVRLKTTH